MGVDVDPKVVDLEAGSYVVEAVMPSGVILTDEVSVVERQTHTVELDAEDSPSGSHSWQYVSGNLESGDVYHNTDVVPPPRSYGSKVLTYEQIHAAEPASERASAEATPQVAQVWWIPDSHVDGWSFENLNELARQSAVADVAAISELLSDGPLVPLETPTESDGRSHLFRFDQAGPVGLDDTRLQGARQFAVIHMGGDAFVATLPVPWTDVRLGPVQVELMISTRQNPTGSPVAMAVRDLTLGPALAYLGNGALTIAATMFEDVEDMLYGKMLNQFSAAAGAYVLVGTDLSVEPVRWHPWVQHLSDWFGWLADGAILWGTLQLRTATTGGEVNRAKATLKDAFRRGVPVYTLGLRWLIDGLSAFPEDPECEAMLKQVRELSWRVDTRQPFMVLRANGRRA